MTIEQLVYEAQARGSKKDGFICEHDNFCQKEPSYLVERESGIIMVCRQHKMATDFIHRFFNSTWRVWEAS